MRITTKGRYALRAILYLINCSEDKPISIKILSEHTQLSPEFLEQIFFRLRKADIITSTRGPGGGFRFIKSAEDISVNDIFLAVDEGYHVAPCTEEDPHRADCAYSDNCVACDFWQYTNQIFVEYFSKVTLQDVMDKKFPGLT